MSAFVKYPLQNNRAGYFVFVGHDIYLEKRYLVNNERLIQALADSYPMRKAARFVAGLFIRTKNYQERALESLKKTKDQSSAAANQPQSSQDLSRLLNDKVQKLKRMLEDEKNKR